MPQVTNSNIPKGTLLSNKPVVLWIHDPGAIYYHDAVVNPDTFSNFRDGQLLRIHCPRNNIPQQQPKKQTQKQKTTQNSSNVHKQEQTDLTTQQASSQSQQSSQADLSVASNDYKDSAHLKLDSVIVKGRAVDKENLSKQQQLQVSISKDIADRFNLRSRQEVYIELIEPSHVALDHVQLAFKEQYLGRSDMWRLQQHLKRTCVYYDKKILFEGTIKATLKRLFVNNEQVASGYITKSTRVVFRSASAKFFLFIQMSKEMWEFDEDGELYFEKAVSNFLPSLFNRWKEEGANHVVSIVLFTRIYYESKIEDPLIIQSSDGRYYKDFYKVVADWETTDDWMAVIGTLKQEQLTFQPNVLLQSEDGRTHVRGYISTAAEGNVLEAINLALNPFDKHYIDRDLMRTGLSLILITPGVGKFWVNKKLLRLTNERMTDNGIAMDLVCLSPMPLHITPLMCYMGAPLTEESENVTGTLDKVVHRGGLSKTLFMGDSPDKSTNNPNSNQKFGLIDPLYTDSNGTPTQTYYVVPHWLDCSFYHHDSGRFIRQDKFKTRCKMYEIQMMGIMEHDICDNFVPFLQKPEEKKEETKAPTIKSQRSSSSLNDKMKAQDDSKQSYYNNGEAYLSTSANCLRRSSVTPYMEMTKINANHMEKYVDMYKTYDSQVFKTSPEPRFGRKGPPPPTSNKSVKLVPSTRNSFDGIDRLEASNSSELITARHKSVTTWHGDQRRVPTMTSYSQHAGIKGHFDHPPSKKDEKNASDPFKESSTLNGRDDTGNHYRIIRRSTLNSIEGKHASNTPHPHHSNRSHDEEFTISSSTIDPVPINSKFRSETNRKVLSQSPRQAGSLPSIHRQSENSDLVRTSFGGNRLSPSHNRIPTFKHMLINPCNPSDNQDMFTSHLRSWKYALPTPQHYDGLTVHWKSLTTPACLPLTTDYFPSNEELATLYNHYMYTVSASEDTNLYQAGDRNLSEHVRTKHLLIEMLSQRLAQGFQIIVNDSSNFYYPKTTTLSKRDSAYSILGKGLANASNTYDSAAFRKEADGAKRATSPSSSSNAILSNISSASAFMVNNNPIGTDMDNFQAGTEKDMWKKMVWWLSMGHQVHQLTFDSSGQNVEVRRFVKITKFDDSKIQYKCVIWPKNTPMYQPKHLNFDYPSLPYQWNYLDHLVAGYQDELTDNLRFWRARFIVIPRETLPNNITVASALNDSLDEEEKRIALFESWIQNIRKVKWLSPEEREEFQKKRKKEIGFSDMGIKLTTMDPSAFVASDAMKTFALSTPAPDIKPYNSLLSSINIGQTLTVDSKTKDIAVAIQDPRGGVKITDRYWHMNVFRDVFIGTEFVDWLINQFEEITTREKAVKFGNSLMQRTPPLLHSATKRDDFLDGYYYYSLNEEFVVEKKKLLKSSHRKAYGNNESGTNSTVSTPSKEKEKEFGHSDSTSSLRQIPSTQSNVSFKTIDFQMSQSIIIDVDPYKKSGRRETAILHYDTIHNPKNCYHFQLNWLGCTAQLVQELVQNWSRQAERCGLKLVEGSVDQAFEDSENNNPFQCPVPISMATPPPPVDELSSAVKIHVPAQFYEIALVRYFDFILDVEADHKFERAKSEGIELEYSYLKKVFKYDQYIHRSGVSFIQIRPDGQGFYWVNNRLYTNHTPALIANRRQPTSHLWHPDVLRTKFQERCNDAPWLAEFWETTKARFLGDLRANSLDAWVFENSGIVLDTDMHRKDHSAHGSTNDVSKMNETWSSVHVSFKNNINFQSPPQFGTTVMSPASPLPKSDFISQSPMKSGSVDNCAVTESIINALKK